tara:strand:+ start:1255 stop:1527 length:273 start_codon:yes stop_codon:yes gene_type:complete
MKIKIGDNQGYAIVDDTTGKILFVKVENTVEGKFDVRAFSSYSNNSDGTHTSLKVEDNIIWKDEWDEEESNHRMNIIGQNGNTGEHYELD